MALVKCEECGKEISSTARSCPNCGYENKEYRDYEKIKESELTNFGLIGMVIGFISFFIDFFGLVSAIGLVISIFALAKKEEKNKLLAVIGVICNAIELIAKIIQLYNLISLV